MKLKSCKVCKEKFEPIQFAQNVCNYKCAIIHAKNLKANKEASEWKAEKAVLKDKLKTLAEYKNELQVEINKLVRLIDKCSVCHSTLKPLNIKFDAGHVFSVGSNPTIRFNLFNIYSQSVYANQYLSGDQINFIEGIEILYGIKHKELVLNLRSKYKLIKLSINEIKIHIKITKNIVKELKDLDLVYSSENRIKLRKKFNDIIGIY
jgi:hypothetical protein